MYPKRISRFLALASFLLALAACRPDGDPGSANGPFPLDRMAWLGSAEGWGLIGLPAEGGALTYLSAIGLESPIWAPPELNPVLRAWPGFGSIWLQFEDEQIGFYDYATGHLRTYEDSTGETSLAVALERAIAIVPDTADGSLTVVGRVEPWRYEAGGRLVRLEPSEGGDIVAVVEREPGEDIEAGIELQVLPGNGGEPLARRAVAGVRDLVVAAWGDRLYYLSQDPTDLVLRGLSVPELEPAAEFALPVPGRAVGITPSGHRIYVAAGNNLYVYDRLNGEMIRQIAVPGPISALRFGVTGADLMGRLDEDKIVVLQVGVDSVLGVIEGAWDDHLPAALPGGRLVARVGADLVLYEVPSLARIASQEGSDSRIWIAVEWHPPRPRIDLGRPTLAEARESSRTSGARERRRDTSADPDSIAGDTVAAPGYYAVVSAARSSPGVATLVGWLESVGYPGQLDKHEDVMGVIWYRAMVGPYPSRARAEAAARSLGARYGYKPWILSIENPDDRPTVQPDSIGHAGAASSEGEEQSESHE